MRFDVESWVWFAIAIGAIVARLVSRLLLFRSVKRLQFDDWIMGVVVTGCFTVLIVMSNIVARSQSNLLPPGFKVETLTPQQISHREYGSKIVVVVEQMQIAVIWACKSCLLFLYLQLTHMVATKRNMATKLLAVYVALGFVVMEVLYFAAWCRPFHEYWSITPHSSQCTTLTNHRIVNAVFNISSDLIMLCIAIPMFIRSLLPLKRKLILCCIFSLGIFVILASVLNKYYSFTRPYEPTWVFWYVRESSTAILVANLPFTWTLLRKLFDLGAFDESHPPPPTYHSARTAGGRRTQRTRDSGHFSGSSGQHNGQGTHGSTGSQKMSLIGSVGAGKDEGDHSWNSDKTERTQLEEQIHPRDFGSEDLEMGERHSLYNARTSHSTATGSIEQARQLGIPKAVHVSASRSSSTAPSDRRSVTDPKANHGGLSAGHHATLGGGRSAGDRKIRAKMNHA
jgi:hypothetical protein